MLRAKRFLSPVEGLGVLREDCPLLRIRSVGACLLLALHEGLRTILWRSFGTIWNRIIESCGVGGSDDCVKWHTLASQSGFLAFVIELKIDAVGIGVRADATQGVCERRLNHLQMSYLHLRCVGFRFGSYCLSLHFGQAALEREDFCYLDLFGEWGKEKQNSISRRNDGNLLLHLGRDKRCRLA